VIDAEIVAMTKRLLSGMHTPTDTLATAMFEGINFKGDFLKQKITRELFSKEQYLPSKVLDRDSIRGWHQEGSLDTVSRAQSQVKYLLEQYKAPDLPEQNIRALQGLMKKQAQDVGLDTLPTLEY
jgi:trimethylamine--corrinoid protein Co-methyltransferase